MRILTLSTLFPNAVQPNFGVFVERQCQNLTARPDVDLTVINPIAMPPFPLRYAPPYKALRQLPEHEQWHGLDVYRPHFPILPKIGGAANARNIANAVLPLAKQLHAQKPFDLIDAEFFYPDGPAAMLLSKALNLPFTIKARGADIHYWAGKGGCRNQILTAADKSAGLLAVSQAMKDDMVALGINRDKITVHYTGCDQNIFHPDAQAQSDIASLVPTQPYSITVGALIARKNPYLVLEALEQVLDLHHVFVGAGEEETALKAAAERSGLAERVYFTGALPHAALPGLLANAKMLILPSQSEGLANAWVEALACGTPIIISEAGGARELVKDDRFGRIVGQTADNIAAAMRELRDHTVPRTDIRASVSNFTWERNAAELDGFFKGIIKTA
ncbi:glycosyltransferase [Parasphingorhabdus sp. DH2-15]|uniref:glycosyltransferase n=1 Tax=Parasphingorhabdus sp. DH2-15 TaxID=3444112 RepID=UPI003F688D76